VRVLIGGVGYRNLRDHSLGPWLADRLSAQARDGIEVEDVSYHPIGLSQNLQERPVYDRVVLVGAVARGRQPGTIVAYRWRGELPAPAEVQARVAEAVTGVISLDNLLAVVGTFGGFPGDVRVVEVEPADEGWGEGFSPQLLSKVAEIEEAVWSSTLP